MASILHYNLENIKANNIFYINNFNISFCRTTKFHYRYNIDRKFHDLENIDKSKAVDAFKINNKMKNLKWITPYSDQISMILKN